MKSRLNRKLTIASFRIQRKIRKQEEQIRKNLLKQRIGETLEKPSREVESIISESLLSTLSLVPFSVANHK